MKESYQELSDLFGFGPVPSDLSEDAYREFLKSKIPESKESGFSISDKDIHPALFPHQRDCVRWAIRKGKAALFQAFGLGKTVQQLEILRQIEKKEGGKHLVIAPLGVKQEFVRDGRDILQMDVQYVRTRQEVMQADSPFLITNYERVRDGDIEPNDFVSVSLDEASVLRGFGTKTYQEFLKMFPAVPYRFVCTATPSPNKYKELIHYGGFLGVMDTGQALTRFFQRDSTKANNLTLYPHMEEEFWYWMSTWAVFLQKPSDLGYSDQGYDFPELEVRYHMIPSDHSKAGVDSWGQTNLIKTGAKGLKEASREKRETITKRVEKTREIINESPDDHFIIWHHQEKERHEIQKAIPESVAVWGSLDIEKREQRIIDFSEGQTKYLSTKPVIAGSGCNFQKHCHRAVFVGIDYKFNDFIQAIHRIARFKQEKQVIIDVIYTEAEQDILQALQTKWKQHEKLMEKMQDIIRTYGLNNISMKEKLKRSIGAERLIEKSIRWTAVNNDCISETKQMESNSVGFICTSIPFSNKYEYTPSYNCFGHNEDNLRFFEQMDFLTGELFRVLKPGRVYACHVKDWPMPGSTTGKGMYTVDPIHMLTTAHTVRHGFEYFGMITVITDVVRENNQTYRLGWTENCKDSTKMGVGAPEYVLLFRKPPTDLSNSYADDPVVKDKSDYTRGKWQIDAHAFWRSNGNRFYSPEELAQMGQENISYLFREFTRDTVYNYEDHVALSKKLEEKGHLPAKFMMFAPGSWNQRDVWDDVLRMRTLNANQRSKGKEKHICPLQLDIVERLIDRFTNPDDVVFDPFGGIMTVPYVAVLKGRKGLGVELNTGYWMDGMSYLRFAEQKVMAPTLFDLAEVAS